MSTIVIMPGGFHPFHAGHYALYQSAKKAFPNADLYVAATNDQSERPFPFQLKEKLAKLAGVEPGHFIQVKSPFQAKEITQNYNPEQDVLIFVRSEKDRNEPPKPGGTKKDGTPAYFQPWTGKDVQPFAKHAYFAYLPTVEFGPGITSATQIRKAWPTLNDKRKLALVMSLYPAAQKNPKLAQNVVGMFDQVMGGQVEESEEALQFATQAHAGQTRAGGEPYVNHPIRVADSIKQYKQSHNLDALINAALLHDTVEDTDTTHEILHDLFGGLVASLVKELTSDPEQIKKMGKAQYLAHKMAAMSSYALVIKLADRLDNVKDITTARTPEWRQKYKKETEHILNYIEKTRALSNTHKIFIDLIRNKIAELDNPQVSEERHVDGGFGPDYPGTYEQEHENEPFKKSQGHHTRDLTTEDIEADPEIAKTMAFARQHYPSNAAKQEAFTKFVIHALKHSEQDDRHQDEEITDLQHQIDMLKAKINVSESVDYLEEK
jgi:HD domain/Cytidylyltransferase-like